MNKKEWIRNLHAIMEYYADFYGAKEEKITEVYKKEIEQYAEMMSESKSSKERDMIMSLFARAARSWAMEADEKMNRRYMVNENLVKSESVKNHLKEMANRVKGFLYRDKVDLDTMYQYAKGCNLYESVLTQNARRLQASLVR